MERTRRGIRLAGALLAGILAGCSANSTPRGAKTPQAALARFEQAFDQPDGEAAMAVVDAQPDEAAFVKAVFASAEAGALLKQRIVETYGREGWREFKDTGNVHISMTLRIEGDIDDITVDQAAGTAETSARVANAPGGMKLRRNADGRWYILGESLMAQIKPGKEREAAEVFQKIAREIGKEVDRVGKPGVDLADIRKNLVGDFIRNFFGSDAFEPNVTVGSKAKPHALTATRPDRAAAIDKYVRCWPRNMTSIAPPHGNISKTVMQSPASMSI